MGAVAQPIAATHEPGAPGLGRARWLLVLTTAALLATPLIATVALIAIVVAAERINLMLIFLAFVVWSLWQFLFACLRIGRSGRTAAEIRAAVVSHATGGVRMIDPTDALDDVAASIEDLAPVDARAMVPDLAELVDGAASSFGLRPVEQVVIERAAWSVRVAPDGRIVAFGSGYLLAASLPEVAAELSRQLALLDRPVLARALRRSRVIATAAEYDPAGWTNRMRLPFAPARHLGGLLRVHAEAMAAAARAEVREIVRGTAGSATATLASDRAAVGPQLWREHLSQLQRQWTEQGTQVAPHEAWRQAWPQLAAGRTVAPSAWDDLDALAAAGWRAPLRGGVPAPALAPHSALEVLAGDDLARVVRRLDDDTAAIYYNPHLGELYGEAGGATIIDAAAQPAAPAAALSDSAAGGPAAQALLGQVDALERAMVRRDAQALELAMRSGDSELPVVATLAAGVRWLCGDPGGAAAIERALDRHPRAAHVLAGLVTPLRNAGAHATADLVDARCREAEELFHRPLLTTRVLGRSSSIQEAVVPPTVEAAIVETARRIPAVETIWLIDTHVSDGPWQPSALIVDYRFTDLKATTAGRMKAIEPLEELVQLAWPLTRTLDIKSWAYGRRQQVRKMRQLYPR